MRGQLPEGAERKRKMSNGITQRVDGAWTIVVELPRDPETGKRRQKWETVRGTRKDAELRRAELFSEFARGFGCLASNRMTLDEFLAEYLETRKTSREGTYLAFKSSFSAFNKYIAKIPLIKLRPLDIQRTLSAMLGTGISPRTVHRYAAFLRIALKKAVAWKLINQSPCDGVELPRFKKREIQVWTPDEIQKFLQFKKRNRYHALFFLALATGARVGEIIALRWSDVDLSSGIVFIRRTAYGHGYNEPKTTSGQRQILIDADTIDVLKDHRKKQIQAKLESGRADYNAESRLFVRKNGGRLSSSNVNACFKSACRRAGRVMRFHDLRHTHATVLLQQGVDAKLVSLRLGHSKIAIMYDLYSHFIPQDQRQAVEVIEQIFSPKESKPRNPRLSRLS